MLPKTDLCKMYTLNNLPPKSWNLSNFYDYEIKPTSLPYCAEFLRKKKLLRSLRTV